VQQDRLAIAQSNLIAVDTGDHGRYRYTFLFLVTIQQENVRGQPGAVIPNPGC
jgi:hypothetical protein